MTIHLCTGALSLSLSHGLHGGPRGAHHPIIFTELLIHDLQANPPQLLTQSPNNLALDSGISSVAGEMAGPQGCMRSHGPNLTEEGFSQLFITCLLHQHCRLRVPTAVSGEISGHSRSQILAFPTPTGCMLTSFGFSLLS
jgi:hypothetical protein